MSSIRRLSILSVLLLVGGCVVKPREAERERERLDATADALGYANGPATRPRAPLPEVPSSPSSRELLRHAFLANGDLEAAFHEWAMAVHRIDQAGSFPNQPLELGFDYMFSSESMTAFDRTTTSVGLMDPSALPNKAYAAATVAWRDAQAAGERFRAKKFELQARVLTAWADYALQAERIRIQEENLQLLRLVATTAASRVRAGASQQELLRADVASRLAENELATAQSELSQQRARLNALLGRPEDAPLEPPAQLPEARPFDVQDDAILAAGVSNNPELGGLEREREGRVAAIRRARLEYMPEVNVMASFTGSLSQSIGAAITLPTQLPRIRSMVAEARSDLRRVDAMAGQRRSDRAAEFLVAILAMRDSERRIRLFEKELLPLAARTVDLARQGYSTGNVTYVDLIDAQRTNLDVRLSFAEARTSRERMLAEIEKLAGADAERITTGVPVTGAAASTQPRETP